MLAGNALDHGRTNLFSGLDTDSQDSDHTLPAMDEAFERFRARALVLSRWIHQCPWIREDDETLSKFMLYCANNARQNIPRVVGHKHLS